MLRQVHAEKLPNRKDNQRFTNEILGESDHRRIVEMKRAPLKITGVYRHKFMILFARNRDRKLFMPTIIMAIQLDQVLIHEDRIFSHTISQNRRVQADDHRHDRKEKQS